jgi:dystonin
LKQAFDLGLLWDTKAPISMQRAIHQGIYDDKTGRFLDPMTQRKITLHEGMRKFFINPQLPCHFIEEDETMLNLSEVCRAKLIDKREGVFKQPHTNNFVPLNQAMNLGWIVDIEGAGFGLYETLAMGFYDKKSHMFVHPVSNRRMTLQEALNEDLVNAKLSLVKNSTTNKYVKLGDAIKSGIIDDTESVYHVGKGKVIDLQEARRRGFIVTTSRLISIERMIKMLLYRADVGKFIDPKNNELYTLQQCIDNQLIDEDTTVFKDIISGLDKSLRVAIDNGDIDVKKGIVRDPKSKSAVNYEIAFNKGLLVTVPKILKEHEAIVKLEKSDLLASPSTSQPLREMSLQEAINYKIIDPETAFIKDRNTGKFKQLKVAITDHLVDPNIRAIIDLRQLFFVFDPTVIVYVREPISFDWAVESNLIDLDTGKFRDPLEEGEKVYTLKDAISLGLIDQESVLLKDGAKRKLLRLPEAFRKGLIDGEKANVLDTSTSKLHTLKSAVETGLLTTPKHSLDLKEAIVYDLYDPSTGCFNDPFTVTPTTQSPTTPKKGTKKLPPSKQLTLADSISKGLVTPTTTLVRDHKSTQIIPLQAAILSGLVDAKSGKLTTAAPDSKLIQIDFVKAFEKSLLLPAEQRVSFSFKCMNIYQKGQIKFYAL